MTPLIAPIRRCPMPAQGRLTGQTHSARPILLRMTTANPAAEGRPARLAFRKMHGLGNDFLLLDLRAPGSAWPSPRLARALADRRTGVGCDQLVGILPGDRQAAAGLRFWNADGSEAGACGNGTRCAADLLFRETGARGLSLRTSAGLLHAERAEPQGCADEIRVDLGPPKLGWEDVPLAEQRDTRSFPAPTAARCLAERASAASMGNPHCILFVPDVDSVPVDEIGAAVAEDPLFPESVNVSFARVLAPDRIRLRVRERGSGETRACGSAACATLVAAVRLGLTDRDVRIEMNGGILRADWPDDAAGVRMQGPVAEVYEGVLADGFFSETCS